MPANSSRSLHISSSSNDARSKMPLSFAQGVKARLSRNYPYSPVAESSISSFEDDFSSYTSTPSPLNERRQSSSSLSSMDSPLPFVEEKATPAPQTVEPTWRNMPKKGQLAILSLSRLADFFQIACLQAIMFHQLKSFSPEAEDSLISWQAGMLQGGFTAAQILSAIFWGRVADKSWSGRKKVLLIGFLGTGFCCIGVAFAQTFAAAVAFRVIAGTVNGTIGAARTMVAETVEKKYHSRAFILLPLAFNIANILGPMMGGHLAEPLVNAPELFGPGTFWGGEEGVQWMKTYPFAAPNLLSAFLLLGEAFLIFFFLEETLASRKYARDTGLEITAAVKRYLSFGRGPAYTQIEVEDLGPNYPPPSPIEDEKMATKKQVLPFSRIWTSNVCFTMLSIAIFHFHNGAFASLWIIFLSTTRADIKLHPARLPFVFTGGLAFSPRLVGFAMAMLGLIGVTMQLFFYPRVSQRLGLLRSFRYAIVLFPVAYFLAPYLSLIPGDGFFLWFGIAIVLFLTVTAQTFALPAAIILTNNCSPHPSVLGTIHGVGQSTAATFKTLGSVLAGQWYANGITNGIVGTAWWAVAAISILGCVASYWVYNGSGHEIFLPGEKPEEDEQS